MSQQNYKDGIYFIRKLRHYALRADEAIFETESGQPDPSALERMQEVTRFYEQIENYAKQLPPNVAGAMEKMDLLKSIYQEEQNDLNTHELVESFIDTTNWTECIFTRYVYLTEFHRYRPYSRKTTAMIPKHLPYSNWGAEDANKHPHKLFEAAFAQLQLDLKNMKPRSGIVPTYLEQNSMSSIIELKFGFFCPTQKNTFICSQKMLLVEEFGYFESLQFIAPHEEWAYNEEMGEKRVDLTKESQYLIFRKLTIQGNVQLTHTIHPYLTSNAMKNLFMQLGKYQEVFRAQCKYCRKHMKDFMPPYVVLAAKQTQFDFAHETYKLFGEKFSTINICCRIAIWHFLSWIVHPSTAHFDAEVIDGELHYVNFIGGHENWPIDDDCWGNREYLLRRNLNLIFTKLNITYESRYHVYKSLTIRANELLNKLSDSSFSTNPNDMAKMNYTLAKFGDVFYNTCTGCQKADRNRDWEDCLQQVIAFDSVEDFWSLFYNIAAPSSLNWGSDYYLFKEGIRPMWEDKQNHKRKQFLDDYWLELLMAIVGEQFGDYGDHICGAVLNVRNKGDKISLWTHDASQDSVNSQIGKIFKAKMNVPDEEIIKYEVHKDASKRASSIVKPRITIQGESIVFEHNNDQHKPQPTAATVETKG
ncbi:unnamed protein product, partial [Mesorhabditis belari]|uniref:EIF-4F 25 kDa subunit n=1 Tax=Mesorhabditis belari TaxID=2138241 RepID=A0AAF3F4R4_9BILA